MTGEKEWTDAVRRLNRDECDDGLQRGVVAGGGAERGRQLRDERRGKRQPDSGSRAVVAFVGRSLRMQR